MIQIIKSEMKFSWLIVAIRNNTNMIYKVHIKL